MKTVLAPDVTARTPLSRQLIVEAALGFIDLHGLSALSMHKLGAALDVKAMSLYHHVADKEDLLDGVVEVLWAEVEQSVSEGARWRHGLESFAHAVRDVVRRHPRAASLIFSQQLMPEAALRVVRGRVTALIAAGFEEERAYDLVRTVTSYVFGSAFAEVTWGLGRTGCAPEPEVGKMLRPGTPEDLAAIAEIFCGQSDVDAQFELGLDLMLRGIKEPAKT